jgi:hypothetical protein
MYVRGLQFNSVSSLIPADKAPQSIVLIYKDAILTVDELSALLSTYGRLVEALMSC